jgi:uncharacterized protein (TIGR02996 family)
MTLTMPLSRHIPPPRTWEESFLADIIANPNDDAPRLIYADWLEDNGQPERSEFIHVQIELPKLAFADPLWSALSRRQAELLEAHGDRWLASLPRSARRSASFRRGFLHDVQTTVAQVKKGPEALLMEPVQVLRLGNATGRLGTIADLPWLNRLSTLSLSGNRLTLEDVLALAGSPHLTNLTALLANSTNLGIYPAVRQLFGSSHRASLTTLDLSNSAFGDDALRALVASQFLPSLTHLSLRHNTFGEAGARALAEASTLPRLRCLELGGGQFGEPALRVLVASPRLASLRELSVDSSRIGWFGAYAIAASPYLAGLEALRLWNTRLGPTSVVAMVAAPHLTNLKALGLGGNRLGPGGARALAEAPKFTTLTHLDLCEAGIGADGAYALANSPHLANLTTLALRWNQIGDEGALALAGSPSLVHLSHLDLRQNQIGEKGATALRQRFGSRVLLDG